MSCLRDICADRTLDAVIYRRFERELLGKGLMGLGWKEAVHARSRIRLQTEKMGDALKADLPALLSSPCLRRVGNCEE